MQPQPRTRPGDVSTDAGMDPGLKREICLRNASRALAMRVDAARRDRADHPSAYREAGEDASFENMHKGTSLLYKQRFEMSDTQISLVEMPSIGTVVKDELDRQAREKQ
mmetsp:Transcript_21359/g.49052  ORF Transcript_21359/g.49052 Transcript_21359/m.49052 type:complete len:109 (+) Transcript_21359:48-374(+)